MKLFIKWSKRLSVASTQTTETLKTTLNQQEVPLNTVTCIVPYSKGFVVSCGKGGGFLYERVDEKEAFRKIRELKIPPDQNSNDPSRNEEQAITSMCISPSEETLLVVTNWQQLYQLVFSNIDVGKVDHADFEYMSFSNHHAQITGLDVCIRKPLVATCSTDKSVRIWNFETGYFIIIILEINNTFLLT